MTAIPLRTICRRTVLLLVFSALILPIRARAQDDQDDPPTRVARLGFMEGSVSFLPAGEDQWVGADPNRPMTTGDKLWVDQNSRAEVQLGFAVIRLNENTGFSFLNLDDHTVQIQLSSGALNVRVRRLNRDDDFEIDTPNLAFVVSEPGSYRAEASEDGTYTVIALRDGGGQATGNGQTYTLHAGQRATFSGTDTLNAEVEDLGPLDPFDQWAYQRDHRWDESRSAQYLSRDVVGFEDLDDYGQWRDDPEYGHVWFPMQVEAGWAPYHFGYWTWISPWGYTWVDDSPWGYAPFHYGRWVFASGRWGWIAGPINVEPVYAPALVVFIGGGPGGWGGNVGWFPLGPREVYVPPYSVSRSYMNQVNVSNTVVNTTVITNVYNTTVVNKTVNLTNVTYVNRSVQGAVTVVPQNAFASAQPVSHAAVAVAPQQIASAPIAAHVAIVPTQQAVLGAKASTAGHVSAPPAAVTQRQVVAKKAPPPPPVSFAKQQQALAANPGRPVPTAQLQKMQVAGARPLVKQAPPGKPATPTTGHPNPATATRQGQPPPSAQNRPQPAAPQNRPPLPSENRSPQSAAPQNRPAPPAENRPSPPNNRPPSAEENRPAPNRPEAHPEPAQRPAAPTEHEEQRTPPSKQKPKSAPQQKKEEGRKDQEKPPGI